MTSKRKASWIADLKNYTGAQQARLDFIKSKKEKKAAPTYEYHRRGAMRLRHLRILGRPFTSLDLIKIFGLTNSTAISQVKRWRDKGWVEVIDNEHIAGIYYHVYGLTPEGVQMLDDYYVPEE